MFCSNAEKFDWLKFIEKKVEARAAGELQFISGWITSDLCAVILFPFINSLPIQPLLNIFTFWKWRKSFQSVSQWRWTTCRKTCHLELCSVEERVTTLKDGMLETINDAFRYKQLSKANLQLQPSNCHPSSAEKRNNSTWQNWKYIRIASRWKATTHLQTSILKPTHSTDCIGLPENWYLLQPLKATLSQVTWKTRKRKVTCLEERATDVPNLHMTMLVKQNTFSHRKKKVSDRINLL